LTGEAVRDEVLSEFAGLGRREGPADDVTAVDVQDDVEIEVEAAVRAAELGDVLCRPSNYADLPSFVLVTGVAERRKVGIVP
jgi:hypothetical protein